MSYRNSEIWQLAKEQSNKIHFMSLKLPKFELYETQSLKSKELYLELIELNDKLGKKLNLFIQSVERTQ
ncbi:MAG: hypothetical protein JJ892_13060 [Balneola sp.]|nr:hypothetical protein [Balneola sp.]MBO6649631.1 hypothetical protein [Balneola sp.]MBO6711448.1 hypothetical protein [Balneola sp.]MBO6801198.1 hypothetical protein [Balneola sp.]MBO6869384.1 hypothetical protein [Balneola sp.]